VSLGLVCFDRPLLPPGWPQLSRPTWDPIREFPTTGHLSTPDDDFARDSAYALFRASGVAGIGDPGRSIREFRREKRDRRRNVLVSWSQMEFLELSAAARWYLYPALPDWWVEVEVSTAMSVPITPVLTYRGSGIIRGDPLHWAIFRSEWTVLIFGRWCADVHFRGIIWYLMPKLRDWISQMGEAELLEGSGLDVSTTILALMKHDAWNWASSQEDDREDSRGVPIRCTQGDVVILKKGAEATGVVFGTQLHDPEWNPALLDPPPWILNSTMSPRPMFQLLLSPACDLLLLRNRDQTLQPALCPRARVPMKSMGRVQREGEERASNSFAEWAPWNRDSGRSVVGLRQWGDGRRDTRERVSRNVRGDAHALRARGPSHSRERHTVAFP
jgi:hypothetical protein